MSYSIAAILHNHKDKNGLQKILIRVIYKRSKIYCSTEFKVSAYQFNGAEVINHSNQQKINALIRKKITEIETALLDAIRDGITTQKFKSLFKKQAKNKSVKVSDYIQSLAIRLTGKFSAGTIKHLQSLAGKVENWFPETDLDQVNVKWLESFEAKLRTPKRLKGAEFIMDNNTINSNMKRLKTVLNKAAEEGLVHEQQFNKYKVPLYRQKLVEYLSEDELRRLTGIIDNVGKPGHRVAGYYFLLSCYTGWRISDVKRFNYDEMVKNNRVMLRAKKNGQIVSIPVHTRLSNVLTIVRDLPFDLSEQKAREYVKELCSLAGIRKQVSFHTGRHSFAMLLMANGFTIDEAAELLGDSAMIAKVYARVHNDSLDKKIREKLG